MKSPSSVTIHPHFNIISDMILMGNKSLKMQLLAQHYSYALMHQPFPDAKCFIDYLPMASIGADSMGSVIEHKDFACAGLPGLKFSFPLFPGWELEQMGRLNSSESKCLLVLGLPEAEKIEEMGKRLRIDIYKTESSPFPLVVEAGSVRGTTSQKIPYVLYQNNELRLQVNGTETVIILINDHLTFGGENTGSMMYVVPAEEHGFDYGLFWKEIIATLEYDGDSQ
jgi:hypothetical protein